MSRLGLPIRPSVCLLSIFQVSFFYPNLPFILQGKIDNNQGQDRLTGPKALDPKHYRKQTL